MLNSVGFSFSKNIGKIMENLVFLQLRKHHQDIFYYKTNQNHEVDFYVPSQQLAIQVSQEPSDEETRLRELRSLIELSEEKKEQNLLQIVTLANRESITIEGTTTEVLPLYEWLLSAQSP
jgi:predicted AAA+ superfamily ATPase